MSATGTPSTAATSTSTSTHAGSHAAPTGDERDGRSARFPPWLLLLVPVVVLVVLGWTHRWVEEDAFLNFRVVDQIRAGHGPVFNAGERVEVATSPLWLWMLVVARTVLPFVKLEYSSIVMGLALTGLGLWWAQRGAGDLWRRDRSETLVPLGAMVIAALPFSWEWATSGLENGLSTGWLGALVLVLARCGARRACADVACRDPRRRAPDRSRPADPSRSRGDERVRAGRARRRAAFAAAARSRCSSAARRRCPCSTRSSVRATTGCSSRTPRSRRTQPEPTGRRAGTTSSTSSDRTGCSFR